MPFYLNDSDVVPEVADFKSVANRNMWDSP
jgi:hypothetical protein